MIFREIVEKLKGAGIESAALDARLLIKHVTRMSDADLIVNPNPELTAPQEARLKDMISLRLKGKPVSKIIGEKEFYGRIFAVNEHVLDPRPDSEVLIDTVLRHCAGRDCLKILDLGTGSGCLVLTLLAELPQARGTAVDISPQALRMADGNASGIGVADRVDFIESDWLDKVGGTFDIIVSNPPYIASEAIAALRSDVREYDPIMALDGGTDGLNPYKILFPQIRRYLEMGGIVAMECGENQADDIMRLMENPRFGDLQVHCDLAGIARVVSAVAV